jgi:hypothetical protein
MKIARPAQIAFVTRGMGEVFSALFFSALFFAAELFAAVRCTFPALPRSRALVAWAAFAPAAAACAWSILVAPLGNPGPRLRFALFGSGHNLAFGKAVTMSSASSSCTAHTDHSPLPVGAELLVDGDTSRPYDACTKKQKRPWVEIDLGALARIDAVVVVGRSDCCWGFDALPLVLAVSNDGVTYTDVGRRALPFSQREPWRVPLGSAAARFVRLRVDSRHKTQIVLSEIEVLGTRLGA